MTTLGEIGEKAYLRGLLPHLHPDARFVNGFGQDASVIDVGLERNIAFKIDRAPRPIEDLDPPLRCSTWGRLAVAANVSDLLAVGSQPVALMLSIVAPRSWDPDSVTRVVRGCEESCASHGIAFLGGDTKEGPEPQVVGAAIGTIERGYHIARRRASPGDCLVLAGTVGGFLGSYLQLRRNDLVDAKPGDLLEYICNPVAWMREATAVAGSRAATAGCDLSDGLADALEHFCGDEVGVVIRESDLPLHQHAFSAAQHWGVNAYKFAFGVGDWAIAYVMSESSFKTLRETAPDNLHLKRIGVFTTRKARVVQRADGSLAPAPTAISEQFRARFEGHDDYLLRLFGESVRPFLQN
jgi:thiamine-monophosphate kinase